MVLPVALLAGSAGVNLLSTVANWQAGRAQARVTNAWNASRQQIATAMANQSYAGQARALGLRGIQESEANMEQSTALQRQALQQKAAATNVAAESGVSGASVDALLQEYNNAEAQRQQVMGRNLRMSRFQAAADLGGLQAARLNQINQFDYMDQQGPGGAELALGIASTAMNTATTAYSWSR